MRGRLRGHAATVLVAALATAFGIGLLGATEVLLTAASTGPTGASPTAHAALSVVALVFTGISIYVAAIVTTNTVATIVVGRTREIALVRLLGATADQQRRRLAQEGLTAAALGAVIGSLGAWVLLTVLVRVGVAAGTLPRASYHLVTATMLVPVVAVVVATWLAAWVGARPVLTVSPVQALGASVATDARTVRDRPRRNRPALALAIVGVGLLGLGALAGQVNALGLLIALPGGVLSFTGLMLGASAVIPWLLAGVGRLLGRDPATRLGTRNPLQYPERSTRATLGLVIGVGLVSMFVVAGLTSLRILHARAELDYGPAGADLADQTLAPLLAVLAFLVGFSAVIAAVGLINTLTVGVLQRGRELGLVRALGLSRAQVRRVITVEAVQLAVTAVLLGLGLGIAYGWLGAQALLGFVQDTAVGYRLVGPVVPWWLLAGTAVVGAVLALAGSLVPARRAVRIAPVEALAAD